MGKKISNLFVISILIFSLTSITLAQTQTGSIHGIVTDTEGNPLPGVTLTATSPSLMGEKTYISTPRGVFRFPALPPGVYTVKAELSGFKTLIRKGIIVNVGKTTEIKLVMEIATLEEEVTVVAEAPTVDVESAKVNIHYGSEFIASIPINRDLYDIQNSLPGAISEERSYRRTSSVLGGTVRSQVYALDGVIMNDPATFYSAINVNIDVYEEVEVIVGGQPAEVGLAEAAYINIVTKSGGNKFSGGLTTYYTSKDLSQDLFTAEQIETLGVNPPEKFTDYKDGSINLGGPIIKDKAWFFINGRRLLWKKANPLSPEKRLAKIRTDLPGAPTPDMLKHYDFEHKEWLGFAKLTFQLTKNIRYMGMLHYNHIHEPVYTNRVGSSYSWPYTAIWDHENSYATSHQFNWIIDQNTYLDIRGGYVYRYFPIIARPEYAGNYTYYDRKNRVFWGYTSYNDEYWRIRIPFSIWLTRFQDNFLGADHEFKIGLEAEQTYYNRDWYRDGNPYYSYWRDFNARNPYYYSTSGKKGRLRIRFCPDKPRQWKVQDHTRRFSGFMQDNLTAGRFALNLGIRLDYAYQYEPEQSRPELRYKYGPELLNPEITDPNALLEALIAQIHAEGKISPFDALTVPYKKIVEFFTISPRIGIVFDLFGDGKTAIKASYARYYEPVWSAKYNASQIFGAGTYQWNWYDLNANKLMDLPPTDKYVLRYEYVQDPTYNYYVKDLKCPYTDEIIAGIEHELFRDFKLGIQFVYKQNKNIVEDIDKNNGYDPNATDEKGLIWIPYEVVDPGWDGVFGTDDDKTLIVYGLREDRPAPAFKGTNPPEAKREYKALVVTFDKRMSNNWQLKGSILYSSFKGNCSPLYGPTEGESGMFDSPNSLINAYGPVWFDRPLQIKLMGTYVLPYGFIVSAYFQHLSGAPWTRTFERVYFPPDYPVQRSYVSVNADPRGSKRRPSYTNLDLRFEKTFSLNEYGKLSVYLDIFNVGGYTRVNTYTDPYARLYYYKSPPKYVVDDLYGTAYSVTGVRSIRLGLRWSF